MIEHKPIKGNTFQEFWGSRNFIEKIAWGLLASSLASFILSALFLLGRFTVLGVILGVVSLFMIAFIYLE